MFSKLIRLSCTLLVISSVWFHAPLQGATLASNTDAALITVDGKRYSPADFANWWENWQEEGMPFPDRPDTYVDWLLFAREAERMELFNIPSFRKKVEVFLKVRSLMLLKYEEIDSKITISEEEARERYQRDYIPLWRINVIAFRTQEDADLAYGKLLDGSVTVEELAALQGAEGGPRAVTSRLQRPISTHAGWQEILRAIPPHGFSRPTVSQQDVVILHLLETNQGSTEDFAKLKSNIQHDLWKEKEGALTYQLIETLKEKYQVKINQERLDALTVETPDAELADTPILTFAGTVLTEKEFIELLRNQSRLRGRKHAADDSNLFKEQVLNGIISQNLTNLEALERHYEKTPQFESTYQFYYANRLVKSLEARIEAEQATLADGEAEKYYETNRELFSSPEQYRLAFIKGSKNDVTRALQKIFAGTPFEHIAANGNTSLEYGNEVANGAEMPSELKKEVASLQKGEVSKVIPYGQEFAIVKLLDHAPASVVPFTEVQEMIVQNLQEAKKIEVRAEVLRKLRSNAAITVDEELWQNLRKELDPENVSEEKK